MACLAPCCFLPVLLAEEMHELAGLHIGNSQEFELQSRARHIVKFVEEFGDPDHEYEVQIHACILWW